MGQRNRPQGKASGGDIQSRLGPKTPTTGGGGGLVGRQAKKPYARPSPGGPSRADGPGKWKHDKFSGIGHSQNSAKSVRNSASTGGTRLRISNLHPQASQDDVHTAFSTFGTIVSLVIEQPGNLARSQGQSVLLTFQERAAALRAIDSYHGQLTDGKFLDVLGF